ncbi:MAG TPA: SpoIIE family protein phosphatase [Gemmatimonadaceae bacterium]
MGRPAPIEWGVASRPKPGEMQSGDRHIVIPYDGGVLMAAVDALGHGDEAAESAAIAETALRDCPSDSVISQVKYSQAALRGKRGVVMSLAKYESHSRVLSWLGVGNVETILFRPAAPSIAPKIRLVTRGGVVGSSLPELRAEVVDVSNGGLLLFATDGIESSFGDAAEMDLRPPQVIATDVLKRYAKASDDALVLAVRLGAPVA